MEIKEKLSNDELTIMVKGRLDALTSNDLYERISNIQDQIKVLNLDLSELDYISSAGLRALAKAQKFITNKQAKMIVKNVNTAVMTIFKMARFDTIITIE